MAEIAEAVGIVVQCIVCMFIIDELSHIKPDRKVWIVKGIFIILNFCMWYNIEKVDGLWNILSTLLDTIGYFTYLAVLKRQRCLSMFAVVMATQIINQVGVLIETIIIFGLSILSSSESYYIPLLLLGYFINIGLLYPFYILAKKYEMDKLLEQKRAQYIIIITGLFFQIAKLTIRINHDSSNNTFLYVALTILIMGIIFGILWIIDWYCTEREKRLLWEDNDRMSKRLHKSKELIPALNSALNHLKIDSDSTALDGILEEIHQLCQEQLGESRQWDMQEKSFPSTGIHILDEQIQLYGKEAAEKSINFDVFVGAPLPEIFKERHIKELDFLRLIGDLVRNAFRAIEKSEKAKGNILLVIGCIDDIFQVDIYDDGAPFPLFILNEFGKRGNTQGGTGNGIADMLDFLEQHKATYQLTEYGEGATFSKGISIIWNGKNGRWIDSYRSGRILEGSLLLPKEP